MRASEIRGKDVIDMADGHKLGTVRELRLDLKNRSVAGIALSPTGLLGRLDRQVIPFNEIQGIGGAAITAANRQVVQGPDENRALFSAPKASDLRRPVLSPQGDQVGSVEDIEFDPRSGAITGVIVDYDEGDRSRYGGKQLLPIDRVMTLSDENMIIRGDAVPQSGERMRDGGDDVRRDQAA